MKMAQKQFFLIIDTETTIKDTVADFGAIVVDRKGVIHKECSVMVAGHFGTFDLFYDNSNDSLWGRRGLEMRTANYMRMLEEGTRQMASVAAINRWLEKVAALYPGIELTAYNLAFDAGKMANTGIDVSMFPKRFCLWHKAFAMFAHTKKYREFILANHLFNPPTEKGNMSFKTNAEVMASFLAGEMLPPEPHTAIEDAKFYELPILQAIVSKSKWREKSKAFNWREVQVKDWFAAK